MKKLIYLFAFLFAFGASAQTQLVTISPFSQIEHVEGQWKLTLPITLNYAVVNPINDVWFYGGGVGVGFNFAEQASKDVTVPVIGFVGAQLIKDFPAVAFGAGLDANTAKPIMVVNLNFYIFKQGSSPNQRKAAPNLKSIIANDDYNRNNIGFTVE